MPNDYPSGYFGDFDVYTNMPGNFRYSGTTTISSSTLENVYFRPWEAIYSSYNVRML